VGAPRGTPPEVIEKLNHKVNAALGNQGIKSRLDELVMKAFVLGPTEFRAHIATETEKWAKVIRAANIKPE
jgi:tripartite-type tricarboxylate transporter receptor subunit TctC